MTKIQLLVLDRMHRTIIPGVRLKIADFSDLATVRNGKEEWAKDPLNALQVKGYVASEKAEGRTLHWRITLTGIECLLENKRMRKGIL